MSAWCFLLGFSGRIRSIIISILCFGPALLAVGLFFLVSAGQDSRSELIAEYNSAVNVWNNGDNSSFAESSFMVQKSFTIPPVTLPYNLNMVNEPSTSASTLKDTDISEVEVYKPWVAKSGPGEIDTSPEEYTIAATDGSGHTTSTTIWIVSTKSQRISKSTMGCRDYDDCDRYSRYSTNYYNCMDKKRCDDACNEMNGYLNSDDSCTVQMGLAEVCLRMTNNGNGWKLDTNPSISPETGCYYENSFEPGIYEIGSPSSTLRKFEIRSDKDPVIILSKISSGTYRFGLTKGTKAGIGISLMAVGGLVIAGLCGGVYVCLRGRRSNKPAAGMPVVISSVAVHPTSGVVVPVSGSTSVAVVSNGVQVAYPAPTAQPQQQFYAPPPYPPQQAPYPPQQTPFPQQQYPIPPRPYTPQSSTGPSQPPYPPMQYPQYPQQSYASQQHPHYVQPQQNEKPGPYPHPQPQQWPEAPPQYQSNSAFDQAMPQPQPYANQGPSQAGYYPPYQPNAPPM